MFLCMDGGRSLDVAAYFAGHAFSNVKCVRHGLAGWREGVGEPLSAP